MICKKYPYLTCQKPKMQKAVRNDSLLFLWGLEFLQDSLKT